MSTNLGLKGQCFGRCANDEAMQTFQEEVNALTIFDLATKIPIYAKCCNPNKLEIAVDRYLVLWTTEDNLKCLQWFRNFIALSFWQRKDLLNLQRFYTQAFKHSKLCPSSAPIICQLLKIMCIYDKEDALISSLNIIDLKWIATDRPDIWSRINTFIDHN
ncbi:hypothetical protein ISS03_03630 [Patescibacteria group bacterium]|nr:hypothetical protein [Patescibacteria group bacterium]